MKRMLAMLLAVMLVVSAFPVGVFAEGSTTPAPQTEHTHKVCNGSELCDGCTHEEVEYAIPWGDSADEVGKLPTASGNYYLTNDLVLTRPASNNSSNANLATAGVEINICLNGHNIRAKSGNSVRFFNINAKDVKLTITNCGAKKIGGTEESGTISGAKECVVFVNNSNGANVKVELYNVALHSNAVTGSNAGAIQLQKTASLKAVDCIFQDNSSTGGTGAIRLYSTGTLELVGCTVTGNRGMYGYALRADKGSVSLTDTVIEDNYAVDATVDTGAVHISPEGSSNVVNFTVQGLTKIQNNSNKTAVDGTGAARDLFLKNATKQAKVKIGAKDLAKDAKIGVYLPEADRLVNDPFITDALGGKIYTKNFTANNAGYQIFTESDKLVMKEAVVVGHTHKVCNGDADCLGCTHTDVTYEPWGDNPGEETSLPASGNYYLTKDVTLSAQRNVDGATLNLCLNGFDIKTKDGVSIRHFWLKNSAKLNISNCSADEGIITGGKASAIMTENAGSCGVELYNVVFEGNCYAGGGGGALMLQGSATLKAVSCVFRNNTGSSSAGAIRVYNKSAATLIGCELKNNSAATMSAIRQDGGSLTLIDTVIENNTNTTKGQYNYGAVYAANGGCTFTVKGQTRIVNNKNGDGIDSNVWFQHTDGNQAVITVDGLTGEAMIGVTLQSSRMSAAGGNVITAKLGGVNPVAFFSSDNADYIPVMKDDVVILGSAAQYQHKHKLCTDSACAEHTDVVFQPWGDNPGEETTLPTTGYYYLTKDINLSKAQGSNKSLTLCLNGYTITAAENTRPFSLEKGAVFTITDCKDTGKLTGGVRNWGAGAVSVSPGAVFNLYAGDITGNKSLTGGGYGGAIYVYGPDGTTPAGEFNMYGGKLTKNEGVLGGAIYGKSGAIINIQGGEISENTASSWAGAIYLVDGTLTIKNCRITGNTAATASAIRVESGKGTVTLTDAIIENNKNTSTSKYNYGALFVPNNGCVVTVAGQTRITGNTNGNNEAANFYMQNKAGMQVVLTVGDAGLSGNAMIGVTMESGRLTNTEGRTITTKLGGKDVAAFFQYDGEGYEPVIRDDVVILEEKSYHTHNLCNDTACTEHTNVTFMPWRDATKLPDSGNYYLETDVELASGAHIASDLKLCLNGHTVKFKEGSTISLYMKNGASLSIADCQSSGTITGGTKNYGGMINVSLGSTLNLFGGTITGNKSVNLNDDKGKGGAIYLTKTDGTTAGGVFNMYGGTITGNEAYRGGAVYLCDGSTFNMYGGTITKNNATYRGGAITNDGAVTINIAGGTISENTAKGGAAVYLCNGARMTVSGGEITKNVSESAGGAILMESAGSKLTVSGGKIENNSTTSDGGAIYASRNTIFEMTGGSILGNKANNGAGIYLNEATAFITGGTFSGNEAAGKSGAIAVFKSTVTMADATITGNTAGTVGGGIWVDRGQLTLSGNLIVKDNKGGEMASNLYLLGDALFTVDAMGDQAQVGISAERGASAVSTTTSVDCTAAFFSDDSDLKVTYKNSAVHLEPKVTHDHCLCNNLVADCQHESVAFAPWNDATKLPDSGAYCLQTDVELASGAHIASELKLCLNGHTIKFKEGSTISLYMKNGATLSVTDCQGGGTITGGTKNYGGMINVSLGSTLNLYGGIITGNKSVNLDNDKGKGGAIYLTKTDGTTPGGVFNMYGGTITGNEAYRGGAVYLCDGSTFNMYGGTITKNNATYRGGAITNDGVATINIAGGTISENTAKSGAAVYLCNGAQMTISGGEIIKNVGESAGGAILMESEGSKLTVTGGKIENNSTTSDGGAIYASRNTIFEMTGGTIANNKANNGAGIYLNEATATITGGTFTGNEAAGKGGAIAVYKSTVTVADATITGNTAATVGGGIWVDRGQLTLSGNLIVKDNKGGENASNLYLLGDALFTVDAMGDKAQVGISAERGYGAMSNKTDKDCTAAFFSDDAMLKVIYKDSAVYLTPAVEHVHCMCNNQLADCKHDAPVSFAPWSDAKALPRSGNYYLTCDVELEAAAFAAADLNLCLNGFTVSIKVENRIINMKAGANLGVTDCKETGKITGGVHNYGGVINVNAGSTFNLYGGSITGNKVLDLENDRGKGGAIYLSKTDGDIPGGVFNMYGGSITGNEAYRGGAVFLCDGSTFNLYGGTVSKNIATYRGGAIANEHKANINIAGGIITENTAKNGAAIYVCNGATMTITGGEITKHETSGAGSAILIESKDTKVLMKGGKIANNSTTSDGTIYASRNTIFEMTGGEISGNHAKSGAGVYINESTGHIKGGSIKNNVATGSGAGVYFLKPVDGHISGGNITGNRCDSYGAGVYVYNKATATISGGNISYNTSVKGAGGGVCLMGGTLNLYGGTIGYNENLHKSNKGGGIMMYGGTLNMTGGTIIGNKVQSGVSGAGICTTGINETKNGVKTTRPSKIEMYGGTIADHVGNYGGGVILQSKTVMNVYNGTFRNNEAKGDGGAVYLNGGSVFNMYDGKMIGNKAGNRGGAVCYFTNTSGEISNVEVADNVAGGYGGFLAAHGIGTSVTIKDMIITGHESKSYGGAVSITWNAKMLMENCEIFENKAARGGAMYLAHKTNCDLTNVNVYKNEATAYGGAFYLDVGNIINFTNMKITENTSTGDGGAIYTRANLHLKDCLIDGNHTDANGGGIATGGAFTYGNLPEHTNGYVGRGQGLILENTQVSNNDAVGGGGGVYMAKQNWNTVINSQFTGNVCGETGSALYVADDLMIKGGMTVTGNTSKTDGYAVYFNENKYDGQSHLLTNHEIGGNVIVKDNKGGEVFLGHDVVLAPTVEGYGQDTYFNITLYEGPLTNWVMGEYNYEGSDLNYTITYGTRSFDEPMEAEPVEEETQPSDETTEAAPAEAGEDNTGLYVGIGGIAGVIVLAAVILVIVKKKKTGKTTGATKE